MENRENPSAGSGPEYEDIQEIRDRLANTILICIALLGAPLIYISFLRYLKVGGFLILLIHFIIYLCGIAAALFRRRIPIKTKALFVAGCALLMAATSIVKWGIIGSGVAYFIFCSILVSIFFGVKSGMVVTVINLVIIFATAFLFNSGYLHYNFDIYRFSLGLPAWASTASVYGCYTLVLVACLGRLYNSMSVSIGNLANRTSELRMAKEQMEIEIKNRKQAETALQESEERFRIVLKNLPVGVFVHDLDGRNLIVNDEACISTGYSREELLSRTVKETEGDSFDMDTARKIWQQLIETGESMTFEFVTHRKDGLVYDTEVRLKSIVLQGRPVILVSVFDITERKRAETALRESEERFRTVLENLPCCVAVHDLEGRNLIVNEETCTVKGYTREELLGLTIMETAGPSFGATYDARNLWKKIELGTSFTFETLTQRKDGSLYDSEVRLTKIMLEEQPVMLALVFDITERKKSEEALKRSEMYLRTLVSTIPDLVWLKDIDGKFLYCNSRFEDLFGKSAEDIIGRPDNDFLDKEIVDDIQKKDRETISKACSSRNEERIVFANDGHSEIMETIRTPMYSSDGELVGVLGIGRDITERKKIEENLARRSGLERLITEISSRVVGMSHHEIDPFIDEALASIGKKTGVDHAYLFLFKEDGKVIDNINEWCSDDSISRIGDLRDVQPEKEMPWFTRMLDSHEYVYLPDMDKLPPEANREKAYFSGRGIKSLVVLVMRQGEKRLGFLGFDNIHRRKAWSEDEIVILRIIGETFTNAVQRKQVEREQERLRALLSTAVELAHLGPWELDIENQQYTYNDQFYKIYRTTVEEMGGYTMSVEEYKRRFVHPDDIGFIDRFKKQGMNLGAPSVNRGEHRMLYADGTVGYVMAQSMRVKNSKGIPVKAYGVNQDITEWKLAQKRIQESEEKLARSKKMESLGLLAGGVAHDLNNVLSGIVSYPELLLLDLPADSKLRKPIETIQESGNKAVAIVQDLLTIARGAATTKEPLNLNKIIREYLSSPEFNNLKSYHPGVVFTTSLESGLFNICGSPIHIKKVIMNLVSNASEAIEEHGRVSIITSNRYIDVPLSKYEDVRAGEYVLLSILDNGPGISPENLERIFEPFFTKKVMGISGTGLGLTVVWNTVQDHSGYIDVKSDKDGTKFELYFPITRDESISKASSIPLNQLRGNGELILVVDDVDSQREISCQMLEILGYRYMEVSSGEKAIEYLKGGRADLVLLDMIMAPGISGRETYEQIVKIHPGQKALIISGYTETEDVVAIQNLGAGGYVKKPFTIEALGRGIKKELTK